MQRLEQFFECGIDIDGLHLSCRAVSTQPPGLAGNAIEVAKQGVGLLPIQQVGVALLLGALLCGERGHLGAYPQATGAEALGLGGRQGVVANDVDEERAILRAAVAAGADVRDFGRAG